MTTTNEPKASPRTSADVRGGLIEALRLDLVGPRPGEAAHESYREEVLRVAPSNWYLTGFLVPYEAPVEQRSDDDGDDILDQQRRGNDGDDGDTPEEASARKPFFPSSMGLSVLTCPESMELSVRVAWGDYQPVMAGIDDKEAETGSQNGPPQTDGQQPVLQGELGEIPLEKAAEVRGGRGRWRRIPREAVIRVPVPTQDCSVKEEVPDSDGLRVVITTRTVTGARKVPERTRSVSVFLVNRREPNPEDDLRDTAYIFQPELTLEVAEGFVPRPDLRGLDDDDWDDRVADLQFRDVFEHAVGHNVSAFASIGPDEVCRCVRTEWMPTADVEKVVASKIPGAHFGMEALAAAPDADAVRGMLGPMVEAYRDWLKRDCGTPVGDPKRKDVLRDLMANAERAADRIEGGLRSLEDPMVFDAFRITNRAIAAALRQRWCHDREDLKPAEVKPPEWRPFQLAFVLMNLPGVAGGTHADREVVDLLFFPTGGGKTEAYLGLAAFTMVLRRLRDPSVHSAGVSVIMRYTLRLLTLDQLGRAATLMCALELERQRDVPRLGPWPFEIGLWVGQSSTPNRMGAKGKDNEYSARRRTIAFQNDKRRKPSPIPLENCPWCGWKFRKESFQLLPDAYNPTELRVGCARRKCEFSFRPPKPLRQGVGLPILAVDEPIYQRLPAFLIATVDKFASLPWVGETGGLFGKVERYDKEGFYGPATPGVGTRLERPLFPPDLVIQDELHLISGPLGTMVGLYETAIDALCTRKEGERDIRPKIIASTATVRRADQQIQALFGRSETEIFPPPGANRRDSFFAHTVSPEEKNPRTYLGIGAQGRNLKVVLLRTALALLGAGQKAWLEAGGDKVADNPADPYMTLLGYFNALRELGGSRRIVEDEVHTRLADYGTRRRRIGEKQGLFANRPKITEVRELTSRVNTSDVSETKRCLALSHADKDHIDVALATNMISVGLDITRLGLMVVLGQPKTASEYIQATSRVGRDDERPGLVVTLLNLHRPRDRSHYERFRTWHDGLYRSVEAMSVTPFSPRSVDRGLAGVVVALTRLGHDRMTHARNAAAIPTLLPAMDFVVETISRRAEGHDVRLPGPEAEALRKTIRARVEDLLDTWASIATNRYHGTMQYQEELAGIPRLLYDPLDSELERKPSELRKFVAHRSLRDVEPNVNLWLRDPDNREAEGEDE